MNAIRLAVVGALVGVLVCGSAAAQQPQPAPPQRPGAGENMAATRPPTPAEVQTIVDGWVIVQAQKALDLTDAQFAQFVVRYRALQEARRRHQRARNQLIQEIAKLTNPNNPPAEEAVLREKLKSLDDIDVKGAADVRKAFDGIDEALNVRQQARFRVFLEQVDRRILEILTKARAQAALAAGRRGPGARP